MVVAPKRVAADVAETGIIQRAGEGGTGGQVIHAHADYAKRAGQKFMRTRAHHAVSRHPGHFSVVLFLKPGLERRFAGAEIGIRDPYVLKAERSAPLFNIER